MQWLVDLFIQQSIAHALLILSLVAATGLFLGSIRIRGVSLGVAGVLFSGLFFGHLRFTIDPHVMEFIREFGLILFVYTVGMQVGPGFLDSLRRQGLPLNLMAASVVALGVAVTIGLVWLADLDMAVAVGLFAGGTTNTPALGAAQQALKNLPEITDDIAKLPGLGYAVTYPFGIVGIILAMGLVRWVFRIKPQAEALAYSQEQLSQTPTLTTLNLQVENANLNGLTIKQIPGYADLGVVISRIYARGEVSVATPDTVLRTGDVILAVGPQDKVHSLRLIVGTPAEIDLKQLPSPLMTRRVVVTKKKVLGKTLAEMNLHGVYGVTITRISRAEIEFAATANFRFQFADTVLMVGEEADIERAAKELGNSPKHLDHPQIMPVFVGITLGVILGSWPFHLGNMPAAVRLGLAGGPLLAAIILSRVGHLGPLIWYMPLSANFMLREVGITLFLACVGIKSGDQFLGTLLHGPGLQWMMYGALITLAPLLIVAFVARFFCRLNFMSLCGVLAGSMTDPPALAFANSIAASDAPSISYATVYPLTMFLRVLSAQILVMMFVR